MGRALRRARMTAGPCGAGFVAACATMLAACAPGQPVGSGPSSPWPLADAPINVTCTLTAPSAEPCRSDAERQCKGEVRLLEVTVAETLPPPMADQASRRQHVYRATYGCTPGKR
ncbi:hypothetical protein SAMN06295912_1575 [Sphingomonas laterariae]|uniref:Lipoprotein n=2 Tax=Edaphosphingomonas laterariae TaxID=861865 RepID=A0A239KRY4_9SPHN|nr:hypothetical protein SAMN06295912_1575 [Sphingomonas laterariae]